MTILQLLDLPGRSIAAIPQDELVTHLRPYFPACRPAAESAPQLQFNLAEAMALLAAAKKDPAESEPAPAWPDTTNLFDIPSL
ncbi:hypothetical protein CCP2SC5_740013 [Azospirillaceae bacterium]